VMDWPDTQSTSVDNPALGRSEDFHARAGFHGRYLDAKYQAYAVRLESGLRVLDRVNVEVTPERPMAHVNLTIPSTLSCDEGWARVPFAASPTLTAGRNRDQAERRALLRADETIRKTTCRAERVWAGAGARQKPNTRFSPVV
jgi:hypothetical protein